MIDDSRITSRETSLSMTPVLTLEINLFSVVMIAAKAAYPPIHNTFESVQCTGLSDCLLSWPDWTRPALLSIKMADIALT